MGSCAGSPEFLQYPVGSCTGLIFSTRDMAITVAYGCVFIGLAVSSMNIQCKCLTGTNLLTGVVPCDPDSHQQR